MPLLLNGMLSNILIAGGLFAVVMLLRRWIKNPAVIHLLLVLILVKLIMPAYWQPQIELFPAEAVFVEDNSSTEQTDTLTNHSDKQELLSVVESSSLQQSRAPLKNLSEHPAESDSTAQSKLIDLQNKQADSSKHTADSRWMTGFLSWNRLREISFLTALILTWGTGSIVCFLLSAIRILRFQQRLRHTQPASHDLIQQTSSLAARIGLKSVPRVELISANISPLLWVFCIRARIILPAKLLAQLNQAERETLLLHELAHYRRRDHWVRLLELLATGVYWWNPLLWWLRREIRITEEACCDAWVIQTLPDLRRAYAEVLVKAMGFVSQSQQITAATGMGSQHFLEQRLKSIMCDSVRCRLSRPLKTGIAVLALLLLPFAPIAVHSQTETETESETAVAIDTLPTVEEILNGYHANLQNLLPIEMTYRVLSQENMNCITRDQFELEAIKRFPNLDRSEITVDGKVPSEDEFRFMDISLQLKQQQLERQLTPEAIQERLREKVVEQRYFWTDGSSFHQRWPYWSDSERQQNPKLDQGPVWPPENLNQHYDSIKLISWSKANQPPLRHWFGRNKERSSLQASIGNQLKEIPSLHTSAPLGLKAYRWDEKLPTYSLDDSMSKDSDQYQIVGRSQMNGQSVILVDSFSAYPQRSQETRWRMRAWIDPSRGYLPLRIEWGVVDPSNKLISGLSHHLETLEIKQVANSYYPVKIKYQEYTLDYPTQQKRSDKLKPEERARLAQLPIPVIEGRCKTWEVVSIKANQPIEPETLALQFPEGTVYENKIDGQKYVTGKIHPLSPEPEPEPPEFVNFLEQAPPLQIQEWVDGNTRNLADFRGKVVVLLFLGDVMHFDFEQIPAENQQWLEMLKQTIKAFHTKYAEKEVVFLELYPPGTSKEKIRAFHQFRGFETHAAIDQSAPTGGVTNFQYHGGILDLSFYLIDPDGRVIFCPRFWDGELGEMYIQNAADKLSISLDSSEELSPEEGARVSLRIMEYIISEQIDKALAAKNSK
ncbi:M56 family metallopeptidase [Gimesia maris]|uniref:Regulatory protein BlaR1 n=1 Tax=Gimesia maris TaxID=122 RepID=A0ABX5YQ81_9PLAN|nr:M56 family metallopeptidase [Gimesia maris]QEG17934.1 Regulatory protein BlaR1 [Gimesia maris]QGQ29040.1 peptidase M56 [Gimesia maris]